jgi:hypothetical protein
MPPPGNSKYPSASDMPEMNGPSPGGTGGPQAPGSSAPAVNPVIGAIQTIMQWITALEQKQDPSAAAIKQAFVSFVQAMQAAGGGGAPGGGQPPQPPGGPAAPPPPGGSKAVPVGAGPGTTAMNAGGSPTARPML